MILKETCISNILCLSDCARAFFIMRSDNISSYKYKHAKAPKVRHPPTISYKSPIKSTLVYSM